ncbi:MAG TPA: TonB-dependent receptor plug domain-containing protein, partial [Opitutaceae bacterium]|nr:TonB-dependent receptor plug domain-containing protein [Opitutaceae bacterium]
SGDDSYGSETTSTNSRTLQKYIDVPQKISVITSQFINDYNIQDLHELYEYLPNVQYGQGNSNGSTRIRGQVAGGTIYIDGVPIPTNSLATPNQFFDRVEVVSGPTSAEFGTGQPGGIVNFVSKVPQGRERTSITAGVGLYDNTIFNFDTQGFLSKDHKLQYRAVGFYDDGGYAVRGWKHWGFGGLASLAYVQDENTRVDLIVSAAYTQFPYRSGAQTAWQDPDLYQLWQRLTLGSKHSYLPGTVFPNGAVFGVSGTPPPAGTATTDAIGLPGTGQLLSKTSDPMPEDFQGYPTTTFRVNTFGTKVLADGHIHLRAAAIVDFATFTTYDAVPTGLFSSYSTPALASQAGTYVGLTRLYSYSHPYTHTAEVNAYANYHFLAADWTFQGGFAGYSKRTGVYSYHMDKNPDGSTPYLDLYGENRSLPLPQSYNVTSFHSERTQGFGGYSQVDAAFFKGMVDLSYGWRKDFFKTFQYNFLSQPGKNVTDNGYQNNGGIPRYSITVKPVKWLSIYALHAEQSDPAKNTALYYLSTGNYFALSAADQAKYPLGSTQSYTPGGTDEEVGIKADLWHGKAILTMNAFHEVATGTVLPEGLPTLIATDGSPVNMGVNHITGLNCKGFEFEISAGQRPG